MHRVLLAELHHESNSFNPIITGRADFSIRKGNEMFDSCDGDEELSSLNGIISILKTEDIEILPSLSARAVPNGFVSRSLYEELKNSILDTLDQYLSESIIDGICLALHGSMMIEELGDAEGDFLGKLRQVCPDVPIVCALDMHATISPGMIESGAYFTGYKCAPHTDSFETGEQAAQILIDLMKNNLPLYSSYIRIPMLIAGEKSETGTQPMKDLMNKLRDLESRENVAAASFFMGYPWADNPDSSITACVLYKGLKEEGEDICRELASLFWSRRREFRFHTESDFPAGALDLAFSAVQLGETPVYLSDSGDNPTAGSSGDCTGFLKLIISDPRTCELKNPLLFAGIYDPRAVALGRDSVNQSITLTLGAQFDRITSSPLTLSGIVKNYIKSWGDYNSEILLFSSDNVDIIISSKHIGFTETSLFDDLGIRAVERQIIVCKLGYLTTPHKRIARKVLMALTDGSSQEVLEKIPYKKIPRPIYPLDLETQMKW